MGAVATPARSAFATHSSATERPATRLFEPIRSGEASLEDAILGVWEDLTETGHAGCPVCGGRMHAAGCEGCGSELY